MIKKTLVSTWVFEIQPLYILLVTFITLLITSIFVYVSRKILSKQLAQAVLG